MEFGYRRSGKDLLLKGVRLEDGGERHGDLT